MRPKLLAYDPVKYSSRQVLKNELHVLASACNHTVPKGVNTDLEEMIPKKKDDRNLYFTPESSSRFSPQTSPSRDGGAIPRRQEDPLRRQTRSPPSHRGTRNKEKGAQWRQSLAGRENRYFPADSLVSPTVPLSSPSSRVSPYRRNSHP